MATIQERIQAALARHSEILQGLRDTSLALPQAYQQNNYISDLDGQISHTETHLQHLRDQTAQELEDHKKYSESTFRRFAHRVSGRKDKFTERAAKEKQEFINATHQQKAVEDRLAYTRQLRTEAEIRRQQLQTQVTVHDNLQNSLTLLYDSVFTGQTPSIPEETAKQTAYHNAQGYLQSLHETLQRERQILPLLKQLHNGLVQAGVLVQKAIHTSHSAPVGAGHSSLYSMTTQCQQLLTPAEAWIAQSRKFKEQIHAIDPRSRVKELGPLNIAAGLAWGNVSHLDAYPNTLYMNAHMWQRIVETEASVSAAKSTCDGILREAQEREAQVLGMMRDAEGEVQSAREALWSVREEAFRKVANGEQVVVEQAAVHREPEYMGGGEAPPAYYAQF